jgi:uncharacterized membrane protein YkvA (DUF1232 family)
VAAAAVMSEGPLSFGQRVASLPGLVRDTLSGRYDGLGKGRLAMMALALAYIVSPVDLVPEALLTIPGLMDDAAVAAWLIATLVGATSAYRTWGGEVLGEGLPTDWMADAGADEGPAAPSPGPARVVVGEVVTS